MTDLTRRNFLGVAALATLVGVGGCSFSVGGMPVVDRRDYSDKSVLIKKADKEKRTWGNVVDLTDIYMSTGEVEKARGVAREADRIDPYRGAGCRDRIAKYEKRLRKK